MKFTDVKEEIYVKEEIFKNDLSHYTQPLIGFLKTEKRNLLSPTAPKLKRLTSIGIFCIILLDFVV